MWISSSATEGTGGGAAVGSGSCSSSTLALKKVVIRSLLMDGELYTLYTGSAAPDLDLGHFFSSPPPQESQLYVSTNRALANTFLEGLALSFTVFVECIPLLVLAVPGSSLYSHVLPQYNFFSPLFCAILILFPCDRGDRPERREKGRFKYNPDDAFCPENGNCSISRVRLTFPFSSCILGCRRCTLTQWNRRERRRFTNRRGNRE